MTLTKKLGWLGAIWGVAGVVTLLSFAVWRLSSHAQESLEYDWGAMHYVVLVGWIFFMGYSEGYKGFQKGFSPRVASRALYLKEHCTWLRLLLAPAFCMCYFDATKKRKIVAYCVTLGIVLLVMLFRFIPQPWRGILDFGVVVGLTWGITATLVYFLKFLSKGQADCDPEVAS